MPKMTPRAKILHDMYEKSWLANRVAELEEEVVLRRRWDAEISGMNLYFAKEIARMKGRLEKQRSDNQYLDDELTAQTRRNEKLMDEGY